MKLPMPSPRGTNREGLYLQAGRRGGTYDAAPPDGERDLKQREARSRMLDILGVLETNMNPANFADAREMLAPLMKEAGLNEDGIPENEAERELTDKAMDSVPSSQHAEMRQRLMEADRKADARFEERFPDAKRFRR